MDEHARPTQPPQETDNHTKKRKLLSDILAAGGRSNDLAEKWNEVKAAVDYGKALPAGQYVAGLVSGELKNRGPKNTPEYKLMLEVLEGEYAGRRIWHDIYLTEAALPMAKRDLGKLGVTDLKQLDQPLPEGIVCLVMLALRNNDDGTQSNKIKNFEVLRIDTPEPEPFAPDSTAPQGGES